jgi:hypothetical protein
VTIEKAVITCSYCSAPHTAEHVRTAHPEQIAALHARLARYGRRRRAAERGQDWTKVR